MATATEELAQELLGGARGANSFLFQHSYLAAYDFDSARKILLHSNYEGTDLEELARDIGFRLWTRLTLENWRAKLISLLLATTVWYLIKKNIETTPSPSGKSFPERVTETR